jgi:hypothetical protein
MCAPILPQISTAPRKAYENGTGIVPALPQKEDA